MNEDVQRRNDATNSEVVNNLIEKLHNYYIFPEAAEEIAFMLHLRQGRGDYDKLDDGKLLAELLTTHIQEVSDDAHLIVSYEPQSSSHTTFSAAEKDMGALLNYGFEKIERLAGNIGLVQISTFFSPMLAFRTVVTATDFIACTNALILDLRTSGGGDLSMLKFFASYFFHSDPVHLNDIYWRTRNAVQEYWTLPYIPGQRYADRPIYILTSHGTSEIGEALAYDLQSQQRATIVGEVTAGAANPLERFALSPQFACWIPVGRVVSPVTGTSWEGVGVRPDVEVAHDSALKTAYTLALQYVMGGNGHVQDPVQDALEREMRVVQARPR